jgi:hypothetical protein
MSRGIYKKKTAPKWQSPIPLHHLNFSQEACALPISLSLYLYTSNSETSLIPRSLAHSLSSDLLPIWVPFKLWANLWFWANRDLWAISLEISDLDLYNLWAKSKSYLDPFWSELSSCVKSSPSVSSSSTYQLSLLRSESTLLGEYPFSISLHIIYTSRSIFWILACSDIYSDAYKHLLISITTILSLKVWSQ